ncbi:putative DNA modification/repair radical SAM protein [Enterocloster lavalensis]|uniref:putative DNA modification/repair radical SAM protein n=1 Tax=Enterocloster lavalensis TaxID=460384 RepID=UPI002A801626|nr:putative DNA modification/repair radical SAM protein [Enterocloster lavalensis]
MLIQENLSIEQKLRILTDAAKYDVACTSSGVDRKGRADGMGSATDIGICHSFAADGRCISLLKILLTNQCIYDCKYCVNRCSNDAVRTAFTPDEVCTLTMEFYRRNYIEGLFLSSGILYSADHTMELIYETLLKLRTTCRFNGYIHVKGIPGADQELIARVGYLADRMSVNLELPTAQGLRDLAPGKTRDKILRPMRQIQRGIAAQSLYLEGDRGFKKAYDTGRAGFAGGAALLDPSRAGGVCTKESPSERAQNPGVGDGAGGADSMDSGPDEGSGVLREENAMYSVKTPRQPAPFRSSGSAASPSAGAFDGLASRDRRSFPPVFEEEKHLGIPEGRYGSRHFVPAGQSTQMIVGATPENDFQMLTVTQALYRSYGLKRVFFSAYVPINLDSSLPALPGGPPLLREHRLYQADWLLRFYGFSAEELLSEGQPNFNVFLDPKCDWALRHLEQFPVEVNRADYASLLRVPGMGVKSARRIVAARRQGKLDFPDLKGMGVVLKRAVYFITCSGKMMPGVRLDQDYITSCLVGDERRAAWDIEHKDCYRQLSLFDDMKLELPVCEEERRSAVVGHL